MTDAEAPLARATSLLAAGQAAQVEADMTALCEREPHNARAHFMRGAALDLLGRIEDALAAFERSLALRPEDVAATAARAGMLHRLGRGDEALAAARRAVELAPQSVDLRVNLAVSLEDSGDLPGASACYQQALEMAPADARALQNQAVLLARLGRAREGAERCRELLRHHPQHPAGHVNLGNLLLAAGDFEGALEACEAALRLLPRSARVHADRALALAALARFDESREAMQRAVALDPAIFRTRTSEPDDPPTPDPRVVYLITGHDRLSRGDWHDFARQARVFTEVAGDDTLAAALPDQMGLLFRSQVLPVAPQHRARLAMRTGARLAQKAGNRIWVGSRPRDQKRLRIGYVSADYRAHPGATLLLPVLLRHDRRRYEITAYPLNPDDGSRLRARMADAVERFVDLSALDDHEAAWRIHQDGCDVLVFREGYTSGTRPGILAEHPAPVQLSWAGYHGTLGGGLVHYHVTEPVSDPPAEAALWDESRLFLPFGPFPYPHTEARLSPVSRAALGLPEDGFVFAALHRGEKIDPTLFACWMRLLTALPGSVLWLLETAPELPAALRAHATAAGVDPARLEFAARVDPEEHLSRLAAADLWLDTRWFGSHTTLLDAMAAGVPAITCTGNAVQGRLGHGLLHCAGLPELVTHDLADYERLALALAGDPQRLQALRSHLLARQAPVFDVAAFVRTLEAGYEKAWQRHEAGLPPCDMLVPADAYRHAAAHMA